MTDGLVYLRRRKKTFHMSSTFALPLDSANEVEADADGAKAGPATLLGHMIEGVGLGGGMEPTGLWDIEVRDGLDPVVPTPENDLADNPDISTQASVDCG